MREKKEPMVMITKESFRNIGKLLEKDRESFCAVMEAVTKFVNDGEMTTFDDLASDMIFSKIADDMQAMFDRYEASCKAKSDKALEREEKKRIEAGKRTDGETDGRTDGLKNIPARAEPEPIATQAFTPYPTFDDCKAEFEKLKAEGIATGADLPLVREFFQVNNDKGWKFKGRDGKEHRIGVIALRSWLKSQGTGATDKRVSAQDYTQRQYTPEDDAQWQQNMIDAMRAEGYID